MKNLNPKNLINMIMKPSATTFYLIISTIFFFTTSAEAQINRNSRTYKDAYACGIEAIKNSHTDTAESLVSYCIGNSHDPSKTELQGFNDAIANMKNSSKPTTCTFGYGIYEANGSRSDNFEEGPKKINSMRQVAEMMPGRDFKIYDQSGKQVSNEQVNQWFYVINSNQYGITKVGLTKFALKNCSNKQLG